MNSVILKVDNVGKCYRSYSSELLRFARWFGISARPRNEHWVLRNVSFRIGRGESIGIVGQNGAGKSTLLKMITGTVRANEGHIAVNGRISALLELGLGFNSELTGLENARHALGLMGVTQPDMGPLLASIEEFAEIGEYFSQPLYHHSLSEERRNHAVKIKEM